MSKESAKHEVKCCLRTPLNPPASGGESNPLINWEASARGFYCTHSLHERIG